MNIFQKYVRYLKNNPEGYWFKRKLFGWGWTPAKWQGWAVIGVYAVALLLLAFSMNEYATERDVFLNFLLPLVVLTVILLVICYKKGEKPKWTWGFPEDE